MHNFFITGLPRTRTTWFSNLFTNGNSFCFHELSNKHADSYGIREELTNRPEEYKGIADCLIPFYYQPLTDTLQEHRLVIIERDFDDVVSSMNTYMSNLEQQSLISRLKELRTQLEFIGNQYPCEKFSFYELDNMEVLEQIWYYLVPGLNFDQQRVEMLNMFKMEPHLDKYKSTLNSDNVKSIMGIT